MVNGKRHYRIREFVTEDGTTSYLPERRGWFCWRPLYVDFVLGPEHYPSIEKARERIVDYHERWVTRRPETVIEVLGRDKSGLHKGHKQVVIEQYVEVE